MSDGAHWPTIDAVPARPRSVDPRDVRADDLRYLLAVARTKNRTLAAAELGVDASTVTRRIRALEHALGVELVRHSTSGWDLTADGVEVAKSAEPIEASVTRAVRAVADGGGSLRGNVRVIAPDAFGAVFVAPTLVRLRQRHPDLTAELLTATREPTVHQSGFDIGITVGTAITSRLVSEPIGDYSLGLYATRQYLADNGVPGTPADLAHHAVIWYVDSLLEVGDLDLRHHLPGIAPALMSTNVFAQLEATRSGGGVGLLPAFLADRHEELIRVLADRVNIRLGFNLVARHDRVGSPAVAAVRNALHREIRERRDELDGRGDP